MTQFKRRLAALECLHKSRQPAPPDLAGARRYLEALHRAYGPPNTPPPILLDVEVLAAVAAIDKDLEDDNNRLTKTKGEIL